MKTKPAAGTRVTYVDHNGLKEYGVVKSHGGDNVVFVVYKCNNEWERYGDFTAAATDINNLVEGWI